MRKLTFGLVMLAPITIFNTGFVRHNNLLVSKNIVLVHGAFMTGPGWKSVDLNG
jgi:hypothetical protein